MEKRFFKEPNVNNLERRDRLKLFPAEWSFQNAVTQAATLDPYARAAAKNHFAHAKALG